MALVDRREMRYIASIVIVETVYSELGRVIAKRRSEAGLTQDRFARICGLSRASLANIECGLQKVYVHQLVSIADALGMGSIDGLVYGQNLPTGGFTAGHTSWCTPDPLTDNERQQTYLIYASTASGAETKVGS